MLASLEAVHARRAAGRRNDGQAGAGARSPSWQRSNVARDNAEVAAVLARSGGRGGRAVRSALVNAFVKGFGKNGEWVVGQAAPASLKLSKRRIRGGSIKKNRKDDIAVNAARALYRDRNRVEQGMGSEPEDAAAVAARLRERMWATHAEWSVCVSAWASAYALEVRELSGMSTRAQKSRAREELFRAHRMVGKVAERIRLQRNDPLCLLEVPEARDGLRRGAAVEAALPPPVLPSE